MKKIAIIGGGASGFFTALRLGDLAKKSNSPCSITVFEATTHFLKKVSISGGGRCNVTHFQFSIPQFCENYPRGKKELRSVFHEFQAQNTVEWFKERGIRLVAEQDGRMFPSTNKSATIIDCFLKEADRLGIQLLKSHKLSKINRNSRGTYDLEFQNGFHDEFDSVVLSTGSSPTGYKLAKELGLKITDLAPSLFSFKIKSKLLNELSGTSFENVHLKLKIDKQNEFKQSGPMLITHWGLSGPAILKLSAWAAREMKTSDYKAELIIQWFNQKKLNEIEKYWEDLKQENLKSNIGNSVPYVFTKRFWLQFLNFLEIDPQKKLAELPKKQQRVLIDHLYRTTLKIDGKNRYKDEFVECGGVSLKEINFKSMEAKNQPGIYVTGELLDIDGITGGFNFQNAWSSAWLAAGHIYNSIKP